MSTSYDDLMKSMGMEPSSPKRGRPKSNETTTVCGTYSAYMRHKQLRENACAACLEAKRQYYRAWYAKNRDRIRASRRVGGAS